MSVSLLSGTKRDYVRKQKIFQVVRLPLVSEKPKSASFPARQVATDLAFVVHGAAYSMVN
jgi:hypothetical protein